MDLQNLKPAKGAVKKRKRIGRGPGSNRGLSSGRGIKGYNSRSGYTQKFGFEGGRLPLYKRVPKFGFKNFTKKEYAPINLTTLQALAEEGISSIEPATFKQYGLVPKKQKPVKILGDGELSQKVEVKAHAFSKSAKKAIEDQGGQAINL